jgi:hypothetical protein
MVHCYVGVKYINGVKEPRPALITEVVSEENGLVGLAVFPCTFDLRFPPEQILRVVAPYDPTGEKDPSWHWPEDCT